MDVLYISVVVLLIQRSTFTLGRSTMWKVSLRVFSLHAAPIRGSPSVIDRGSWNVKGNFRQRFSNVHIHDAASRPDKHAHARARTSTAYEFHS